MIFSQVRRKRGRDEGNPFRPEEKERRKNGRMEETETECRKNHYHIFFGNKI